MQGSSRKNYTVFIATVIVAMILDIWPIPDDVVPYWPKWVVLVFIYWCIALPHRIGILTGWMIGLFIDVLTGSLLGLNAFCLAIVAYFALTLYQRIRLFPRWKQSLVIGMLVGQYMLISFWLNGLTNPIEKSWSYWLAMVTSAAIWPYVFLLLRDVRRRFRVN
ncbi:MAG: rod shape-determining protein MreD [Kangiellaceae bacterium]|jgi:rod shape-determining protein MreD|nr:rod shape-determining protein MreD [Kangiellaceae bacterium]